MRKKNELGEITLLLKEMREMLRAIRDAQKELSLMHGEVLELHKEESVYLEAVHLVITQQKLIEQRLDDLEWELDEVDENLN
jgi:hypothetical protein